GGLLRDVVGERRVISVCSLADLALAGNGPYRCDERGEDETHRDRQKAGLNGVAFVEDRLEIGRLGVVPRRRGGPVTAECSGQTGLQEAEPIAQDRDE